jgi:hypothetical protein
MLFFYAEFLLSREQYVQLMMKNLSKQHANTGGPGFTEGVRQLETATYQLGSICV